MNSGAQETPCYVNSCAPHAPVACAVGGALLLLRQPRNGIRKCGQSVGKNKNGLTGSKGCPAASPCVCALNAQKPGHAQRELQPHRTEKSKEADGVSSAKSIDRSGFSQNRQSTPLSVRKARLGRPQHGPSAATTPQGVPGMSWPPPGRPGPFQNALAVPGRASRPRTRQRVAERKRRPRPPQAVPARLGRPSTGQARPRTSRTSQNAPGHPRTPRPPQNATRHPGAAGVLGTRRRVLCG